MDRATRQLTPASSFGSSTQTLTLTLETPSSSSSHQNQSQEETLVLKLKPKKKKVTWKEGTVDNEFLNKKSSKKCCIFHKEKPFDEDVSEDEGNGDSDGSINDNFLKKHGHKNTHNCDHAHGEGCDGAGPSN